MVFLQNTIRISISNIERDAGVKSTGNYGIFYGHSFIPYMKIELDLDRIITG